MGILAASILFFFMAWINLVNAKYLIEATDAIRKKVMNVDKQELNITNDYGSEDLTATLTYDGKGKYTLTQTGGSRLKIAVNRKWVKIPMKLELVKQ